MWTTSLHLFLHTPFARGAFGGLLTAAVVDIQAFKHFQSWHDAAEYGWGVATFRWVQGFILGGLGATLFAGVV